jgi:hypothetical protein
MKRGTMDPAFASSGDDDRIDLGQLRTPTRSSRRRPTPPHAHAPDGDDDVAAELHEIAQDVSSPPAAPAQAKARRTRLGGPASAVIGRSLLCVPRQRELMRATDGCAWRRPVEEGRVSSEGRAAPTGQSISSAGSAQWHPSHPPYRSSRIRRAGRSSARGSRARCHRAAAPACGAASGPADTPTLR